MTDITLFPKIIELREKWFTAPYPADTIVEVSSLALPELMVEIDVTALANGTVIDP
jgi:enamine deaminase RidA (YjgF/YER057c/UK114 family)